MKVIKDYTELPETHISSMVSNFKPTQLKGQFKEFRGENKTWVNEYDKEFIENLNPTIIFQLKQIIEKYTGYKDVHYTIGRLNRVMKDTNPSDGYHTDSNSGNIIILHYPKCNPHYEGGNFEWLDEDYNSHIETTENGTNLILVDNPFHRVLNVTEGTRYSFAFFFIKLENKNLI